MSAPQPIEIDLVYLWVDGNDPQWQAKRSAVIGNTPREASVICKGRYTDNEELKYSLRAVEMYAPWIRKIFIVTDNQKPDWLNIDHPKIRVVDLTEFMPEQSLPCFNSNVIEHCIPYIPDLAEHFLYANDDMFINRPVSPSDFFASDGFPIVRFNRSPFRKLILFFKDKVLSKPLSNYNRSLKNAAQLVKKRFGIYFSSKPHHNIDAYCKSDCLHIREDIFKREIESTLTNHIRQDSDIQRILYSYVPVVEKHSHRQFVNRKTSFMLRIHKEKRYQDLERLNPLFFCMNDSQYATDADRKRVTEYLEKRFPEKSQFEK